MKVGSMVLYVELGRLLVLCTGAGVPEPEFWPILPETSRSRSLFNSGKTPAVHTLCCKFLRTSAVTSKTKRVLPLWNVKWNFHSISNFYEFAGAGNFLPSRSYFPGSRSRRFFCRSRRFFCRSRRRKTRSLHSTTLKFKPHV